MEKIIVKFLINWEKQHIFGEINWLATIIKN